MLSTRYYSFKNAGVVLMTNNFVSAGREGECAENKGKLSHRIFLTDTRYGHLIYFASKPEV